MTDFGAQLWDQWLEVENYALAANKSMETLADYFRQRAAIEVEYSQKLSKLAKPHKDEITRLATDKKGNVQVNRALLSSSTLQAWSQLLNETESTAKVHSELAEKMDSEIKKAVKMAFEELQVKLKSKFDEMKRVTGDLQKGIVALDKAREKYEADKKVMENAQSNFEKLLKNPKLNEKDVEVTKVELDKRRAAVKASMTTYQQTLIETNLKKNVTYIQTIPQLLNEINNDDQSIRVSTFKSAFGKYYSLISSQQPKIQNGLDAMNTISSSIDGSRDLDATIKSLRTGEPVPPDYLFEEKPIYEITGKRLGRSPSAIRAEKEESGDSSILSQPHKAGKRAAQDRIKQYDREYAELNAKLQSLENMFSVYEIYTEKDAKDPRYIQQLHEQKENLEIKIINIQLKCHALHEYVAHADGLAPPPLPKHLTGKKIQTPQRVMSPSPSSSLPISRQASVIPTPAGSSIFTKVSSPLPTTPLPMTPIPPPSVPLQDDEPLSSRKSNIYPAGLTPLIGLPISSVTTASTPVIAIHSQAATPISTPIANTNDDDEWTWHGETRTTVASPQQPEITLQPITATTNAHPSLSQVDAIPSSLDISWTDWGTSPAVPNMQDLKIRSSSAINDPIVATSSLAAANAAIATGQTGHFVYSSTAANPMNVSDLYLPRSAYDGASTSGAGVSPRVGSDSNVPGVSAIDGGGLFGATVGGVGWDELQARKTGQIQI
ncbi:UNVERIFIED_CONTAM: Formin-binding protein 1 [Siphonaria sp. JEL0065]|nr:Formin-binding protein 1 [Siphonaria sp. JEL0065]